MIKILYVNSLNLGVCYWRIENYAKELVSFKERCAVHVQYFFDPRDNKAWDKLAVGFGEMSEHIQDELSAAFKFFDVIIFQKIQNKEALALIEELRKQNPKVKIIAEIDDSIGDVTPSNVGADKFTKAHGYAAYHVNMSDAVICSCDYLANSIKPIVGDKPIHVAPNCIDWETWKWVESDKKHKEYRIGYVGAGAHDEDLLIAYRAMLPVLEKDKNCRFVIRYGGYKPKFLKDHPQIEYKQADAPISKYPQMLYDLKLDLALAPLRDTEFNRCKTNLKWIEWSSMGVPVVASNVEPFKNTKGKIFLADNDIDSFTKKILEAKETDVTKDGLIKDNKRNYDLHAETDKLLTFIEKLV